MRAHPAALCHRDFHANNLFPLPEEVGAIDFQDMRQGPDSYDLASLLWERTTLDWMHDDVADPLVAQFASRRRIGLRDFRDRLRRVLLQRAWKVCGTFARAVAQGRGEIYRRYLPGELSLASRLLDPHGPDAPFREVLRGPVSGGLLSYSVGDFAKENLMFGHLGVPELLIILLIVIIIFGASRLPQLGKGLGQGLKNFKDSVRHEESREKPPPPPV